MYRFVLHTVLQNAIQGVLQHAIMPTWLAIALNQTLIVI